MTNNYWDSFIKKEAQEEYMIQLKKFIADELNKGKVIYPPPPLFFEALKKTPFEKTKVVILGQDPYHGEGQAHGLSFSVNKGIPIPPSLKNIYKELQSDVDFEIPKHGYLESWAKQGILLLNNTLSVEKGKAGSHQKKGWEIFTDKVIEVLNKEKEGLVFILWGSPAQKKGAKIDDNKHLVLKSPHPSPLSSYRGFFGSKHFSQANSYLVKQDKKAIDWQIN